MCLLETRVALPVEAADHVSILDQDRVVFEGSIEELEADEAVQQEYLGVGTEASRDL